MKDLTSKKTILLGLVCSSILGTGGQALANNYTISIWDNEATSDPTPITGTIELGQADFNGTYGIMGGSTAAGDKVQSISTPSKVLMNVFGVSVNSGSSNIVFSGNGSCVDVSSDSFAYGTRSVGGSLNITNLEKIRVSGSKQAYGIHTTAGTSTIAFTGNNSSIEVTNNGNEYNYGIAFGNDIGGEGTTVITGLGSVTVEGGNAYGVYARNGNEPGNASDDATFSVAFHENGGSISVYSIQSTNNGIYFCDKGKSEVTNVKTVVVGMKDSEITTMDVCGVGAVDGVNRVAFTGAESSVTVRSNGTTDHARGILLGDTNLGNSNSAGLTVENLGAVNVTGGLVAEGVAVCWKLQESTIAFAEGAGSITVASTSTDNKAFACGIVLDSIKNSTDITFNKVGDIQSTANGGTAWGYYSGKHEGTPNVQVNFQSGSTITAQSTGGHAYGVAFGDGKVATGETAITGLGGISAEGTTAYGVYFRNGNELGAASADATFSVAFDGTTGGSISAYSASGDDYGILFEDADPVNVVETGKSEVTNVNSITAGVKNGSAGAGTSYGIRAKDGVNKVTFTGNDSSVIAKSSDNGAYGIYVDGGTTEVVGSATEKTTVSVSGADSQGSAAVYVAGGTLNLKNFDLSTGDRVNAATVRAGDAASSVLNLTDSVLAGKIKSEATTEANALAINFSGNSAWTVKDDDISGQVKITNTGNLDYNGNLIKDIAGAGTTKLTKDTVKCNTDVTIEGTLNGNSKTIDMQETTGATVAYSTLTIGTLTGTTNLMIDVDMSNFTADKLAVGNITGATVDLTKINVTKDITPGSELILPYDGTQDIVYVVDDDGTSTVTTGGTYKIEGSEEGSSTVLTNSYKYTFTKGNEDGTLNYKVEATEFTFKKFVEGTLGDGTNDPKTLSLTADMENGGDMSNTVVMGSNQSNAAITVNLNGHQLTSALDNTLITITSGKTFNLDGGNETNAGTVDSNTNWEVQTGGTLAISGNTVVNGNITNNDVLTTAGTTTLNGNVTGGGTLTNTGILNISSDHLGNNVTNTGATVNLGGGTLTKKITSGTLYITDNVTSSADNIASVQANIQANKELTLTGGTSTADISNNGGTLAVNAKDVSVNKLTGSAGVDTYAFDLDKLADNDSMLTITANTTILDLAQDDVISVTTGNLPYESVVTLVTDENGGTFNMDDLKAKLQFVLDGEVLAATEVPGFFEVRNSDRSIVFINDADVDIIPQDKAIGNTVKVIADREATVDDVDYYKKPRQGRYWRHVYGGYTDNGDATGNTVIWEDGTIKGEIYGGYSKETGADVTTGNELKVVCKGEIKKVKGVHNFSKYTFDLNEAENNTTVMEVTDKPVDIPEVKNVDEPVVVVEDANNDSLRYEARVCLIKDEQGIDATKVEDNNTEYDDNTVVTKGEYTLEEDGKKLMYTKTSEFNPEGSKAPLEGRIASILTVNSGTDLAKGPGLDSLVTRTSQVSGTETFAAANYGKSINKTGSSVDMSGYNLLAGVGRRVFDSKGNKTTGGLYFEYGNNSYDSYNTGYNGNGKNVYKGVGFMLRRDSTDGNYYEGMLHAGKVTTDWNNSKLGGYEMDSTYYGASATYGHKFMLGEEKQLSVYGSYTYNNVAGGDARINGYDYDFDAIKSNRVRVGMRYAKSDLMDTKAFRPYVGLAWEHEFSGEASATVKGVGGFSRRPDSPTIKGDTGILELGFKTEAGKWTLGIGAEAYTGRRKGWNGTLQAVYNF